LSSPFLSHWSLQPFFRLSRPRFLPISVVASVSKFIVNDLVVQAHCFKKKKKKNPLGPEALLLHVNFIPLLLTSFPPSTPSMLVVRGRATRHRQEKRADAKLRHGETKRSHSFLPVADANCQIARRFFMNVLGVTLSVICLKKKPELAGRLNRTAKNLIESASAQPENWPCRKNRNGTAPQATCREAMAAYRSQGLPLPEIGETRPRPPRLQAAGVTTGSAKLPLPHLRHASIGKTVLLWSLAVFVKAAVQPISSVHGAAS